MTATITARIFDSVMTAAGEDRRPLFHADRPVSLAVADQELARHSLIRTAPWDLAAMGLIAPVRKMDNVFNGVMAVDLDEKVGTTHSEWMLIPATKIQDGDLITDPEQSETYVVAGSSVESGGAKIHMVRDGKEWNDRHTSVFLGLVWAAHKL